MANGDVENKQKRVRFRVFTNQEASACDFATKVGKENLINISEIKAGPGELCTTVWYWG